MLIGRGTERRRLAFALPRAWPPADATALVRRSGLVWRHLSTLVSHERLASGPRRSIHTVYRMVAPDRFGYEIAGGATAIVIGSRRWDRTSPRPSSARHSSRHCDNQPRSGATFAMRISSPRRACAATALADHLLRSTHARLVHGLARQADIAHARPADGDDGALHARRLRPLQPAGAAAPTTMSDSAFTVLWSTREPGLNASRLPSTKAEEPCLPVSRVAGRAAWRRSRQPSARGSSPPGRS